MSLRLTVTAAVAVILASVSIYPLFLTASWFWAGAGAVITVAIGGTVTRLPAVQAAVAGSVVTLVAVLPLLLFPDWGLKVVGVLLIAVTAASRPRLRLLQALSCVIVYLTALLIYLNVTFAARVSTGGIVPTGASVTYLWSLAGLGMAERHSEPPVGGAGAIFLAAAGIGLMAVLTDLLAVRLHSPAIAGLPLLALYFALITTSARQGAGGATVVFCLTLIGYLALLAAERRERLRIWGRLVTVWHSSSAESAESAESGAGAPDIRALAASGRRIGLAAACIALAFPLLIPGISVHDLFRKEPTGGLGGPSISPPDPLVQMQDQLRRSAPQAVLTYHTTAKVPSQQYLQVYVLSYDAGGQNWSLVRPGPGTQVGGGQLQRVPGVAASTPRTQTTTEIDLSQGSTGYDSKLGFLPLPYAPEFLTVPGSWVEDNATLMVYAAQPQLSGLRYSVTSTQAIPDRADESADSRSFPPGIAGYLGFPKGKKDRLLRLAEQITAHARTPYQKAEDLQDYFRNGTFTYSLNATLQAGIGGLEEFLYRTRSGFCQQFAFAMAGLARLVGIPSRIAVGYTAGSPEHGGTWKVTTADAHAWPELYFAGLGWIRFEPTPGGAGGTATTPQYASPPGVGVGPTVAPGTQKGSGIKGFHSELGHLHSPSPNGRGGSHTRTAAARHGLSPWIPLIVAAVIAAALLTPPAARSVMRQRRLRTAGDAKLAHAIWREVRDGLADYGLTAPPSESPRATAARVAVLLRLDPVTGDALGRIVSAEERASYATAPLPSATLRADCATFLRALSRQATWPERWRARAMPASVLASLRTRLQHALDVLGWMEAAGQRFRGSGFGSRMLSNGVSHQE